MANLGKHFQVNFNDIRSNKDSIIQGKTFRITILSERLIRFEYNKDGIFLDAPTNFAINRKFEKPYFKIEERDHRIFINTKYFSLQYVKERPFKGPIFAPDTNLRVKLNNSDKVWYPNHPEARNYKGSTFSLDDFYDLNIKKPLGIKLEKGLYSTDGFVTIDDSDSLVIEEVGTLRRREANRQDFYLFMYRRDFGLCLTDYFKLTGYPSLIPRYALGIWWNRDLIYGENDLIKVVEYFHKYEIPLSVLLLSEYWHLKSFNKYEKSGYEFSEGLFPNLDNILKYLKDRGVHIGVNIDPVEGIKPTDSSFLTFQKELNLNDNNVIPFNMLNKTFAMTFVSEVYDKLFDKVDFLWIDYKEDLKNLEALQYYAYNNYQKNENKRGMILSRNTNVSTHRYPITYTGETIVDFKTLRYLPFFNSTGANIGLSWFSHDVGGFKEGIENSELYLRYVQFSTFNPIFRFSSKRGPYYKREPWMWDIKTYSIVKNYTNLRQKLIPYLYTENYKYHKTGLPLSKPLYYNNPELYDEPLYKNEYLFGSEMLIAPITKEKDVVMNRSIERIYLPKGVWYDFKSGKKFLGDKRYVAFYKDDEYPAFVKAGGIIPMSVLGDNKNDVSNPKNLEINIFPGNNNVYNLYEDDGYTNLYKDGYYIVTSIDFNYKKDQYTLIIKPKEGKTGIIPDLRNYVIKFRNTLEPRDITFYLNGVEGDIEYTKVQNDLDFELHLKDVDTTKQLTIFLRGENIEIDATRLFNDDVNSILDDLNIKTTLKEKLALILFSDRDIKRKRILIRKLRKEGLKPMFINMFLRLLEYSNEI